MLAVVLIGLAMFFAWRQGQTAGRLRRETDLAADDRRFLLGQVWRRTLCCLFMVIFAAFLVGSFFLPLPPVGNAALPLDDAAKNLLFFLAGYWICAFMILAAIIVLAAIDLLATARYGLQQRRKLQHDQQVQLLLEAARLRQAANDRRLSEPEA